MKKLMIAAAAAAMVSGAFAGLCDETSTAASCALYNVKFTMKSLDAKLLKVKGTSSVCGDTAGVCCTYFDNATYTFDGVMWLCENTCLLTNDYNFVLWNKKAKMPVTKPLQRIDPDGTPNSGDEYWGADAAQFGILDRYAKTANKVQAFWGVNGVSAWNVDNSAKTMDKVSAISIYAAGFGTFDAKKGLVKSISGNAAGAFVVPDFYSGLGGGSGKTVDLTIFTVQNCLNPNPGIVELCDAFDSWCGIAPSRLLTTKSEIDPNGTIPDYADGVAASGTWSIKYNASLSNATKSGKTLDVIVPSYAQKANTWTITK